MPDGNRYNYHIRLLEVMSHSSRYAFEGKVRLARDTGLSKMTIFRLLAGRHQPSYHTVQAVVAALEKALGRPLDMRDLISYTGEFDRPACEVCGCSGCLPDGALREDGTFDPAYERVAPGEWKRFLPLAEGEPGVPALRAGEERTLYRDGQAIGVGAEQPSPAYGEDRGHVVV